MKKQFLTLLLCLSALAATAQSVKATWEFSNIDNLDAYVITGDDGYTSMLTTSYALGASLTATETMAKSGADTGYDAVAYDPAFTKLQPSAKVTTATTGHTVTVGVTPSTGHKFKPTKISFDAAKVGTDAGGLVVKVKEGSGSEVTLEEVAPLRNKIMDGNSTGYSHCEIYVNDYNVEDAEFQVILYLVNVATNKQLALRNIAIEGEMDSEILSVGDYVSNLTCRATISGESEESTISLTDLVAGLANGESCRYKTKLAANPTDFAITLASAYAESHTATVTYDSRTATVSILKAGSEVMTFSIVFAVSIPIVKGDPLALKRGTMALHQDTGNLVSWRARKADDKNLRFRLYRGTATEQTTAVNNGKTIAGKTNILDADGAAGDYYRLEVLDADGNIIETDLSAATWDSQTLYIPLTEGAPTDPSGNGASYTPNDASYCDMDGDGEYEIILKWSPSNEKDAASSGATSNVFFDCYKLDGTQLWRIDMGHNFFASAHTMQFIAWDFDGDGFGEFMAKTAPGTIDGQGNYVVMDDDDPTANWKSANGKQVEGPEYITVFDGLTGAELSTIAYHTNYADGAAYWGDSNQNRSERYLAGIAWLDGENANPSPIFARGYYAGAFVGAYDFDGNQLTERWVSRNTTSGSGLYAEGAHWMAVADCDGDGKQDIIYGSAALKSDGSLLYRTGLGHGDALHVGDFDPDNEGLEVWMAHEKSPYGADLRDAKTGTLLWHPTASSDTGRALAAHHNPESEGAYLQYSASSSIYDWAGNTIIESVSHGGGGSLNNRVFWNGTLAEEHYDKSCLEYYNVEQNAMWRIQVNGTNYTVGTQNNSTKYNPCVLGDLLGDWREEIVNWTTGDDGTYYLVVNATNYETDYTVPHLMDDFAYRAQVINQNCCYNQPPHLSYNLRNSKKIIRSGMAITPTDATSTLGNYWDCFYTTYPVIVPDGITAWKVCGVNDNDNTIKVEAIAAGTVIAANTGIIYNSANATTTFVPSSLTADALEGSIITGDYTDTSLPTATADASYYVFADGDRGLGFYLASGDTVEGGTGYIVLSGSNLAVSYVLEDALNPSSTGIAIVTSDNLSTAAIYNLHGVRLNNAPQHGVYITGGKVYINK